MKVTFGGGRHAARRRHDGQLPAGAVRPGGRLGALRDLAASPGGRIASLRAD
jgi:hypothetical protein